MKKTLKILGIIIGSIVLIAFLWVGYNYVLIKRGDLVKWNNQWYTKQELQEMFGSQEYNVQAKNTPEEVYTKFRQALLDNDIEKALEQITEENREEYREAFKNENILEKYKTIPEMDKIKKSEYEIYDNFASYYYFIDNQNDEEVSFEINFIKNKYGFWEIDFI